MSSSSAAPPPSTSADTIRTLPPRYITSPTHSSPASPTLSASGSVSSSISSFPSDSVSSSFFFSSAAVSPHPPTGREVPPEEMLGLVIPSLVLPAPLLRRKRKQGPIIRVLVLGDPDVTAAALLPHYKCENGTDSAPYRWEDEDGVRVLRTDSHPDLNSENYYVPEIFELVSVGADIHGLDVGAITRHILTPFRALASLLAPPILSSSYAEEEADLLTNLAAGKASGLFVALVVMLPSTSPPASLSDTQIPQSTPEDSLASAHISATALSTLTSGIDAHAGAESYHTSGAPPRSDFSIPKELRELIPVLALRNLPPAPSPPQSREDTHHGSSSAFDDEGNFAASARTRRDPNREPASEPSSPASVQVPLTALPSTSRYAFQRTETQRAPPAIPVTFSAPTYADENVVYNPTELRQLLKGRQLRVESARRFVAWWRAGASSLSMEHEEQARRPQRAESERALIPLPGSASVPLHHRPLPPYPAYSAYADPLHVPSLLALARDVLRAWRPDGAVMGAFVAGVVLGVGVTIGIGMAR